MSSTLQYMWFYILFSLCCVLSAAIWCLCCYICFTTVFTLSQQTSKRHMLQKKGLRVVAVGKYAKESYKWHLQHATT
jgi:hypothetical protein